MNENFSLTNIIIFVFIGDKNQATNYIGILHKLLKNQTINRKNDENKKHKLLIICNLPKRFVMVELEQMLKTHDVVEPIDSLCRRVNAVDMQTELRSQSLMMIGCQMNYVSLMRCLNVKIGRYVIEPMIMDALPFP